MQQCYSPNESKNRNCIEFSLQSVELNFKKELVSEQKMHL